MRTIQIRSTNVHKKNKKNIGKVTKLFTTIHVGTLKINTSFLNINICFKMEQTNHNNILIEQKSYHVKESCNQYVTQIKLAHSLTITHGEINVTNHSVMFLEESCLCINLWKRLIKF